MASSALLSDVPAGNGLARQFLPGILHIPKKAHTLVGFRQWIYSNDFPEKLPATYLHGEVILDMSKEEIRYHAAVKTEVGRVMANLNVEDDFGNVFINGVLVTNEAADVSNNPDIVAVFWESLEAGLVHYITRQDRDIEIVGSPDWVLEIISDSSVTKDTRLLRRAYHEARIREYWLIDARGKEIDFQILYWRKSDYAAAPSQKGWLRSRVFRRQFRLTRQRDRRGAWKYSLEVKAL